jgi:hypothetical protein
MGVMAAEANDRNSPSAMLQVRLESRVFMSR